MTEPRRRYKGPRYRPTGKFSGATKGKVTLENGYWYIEALPHILLRLRRTFAGISTKQMGYVRLKATDEVSRDLLWFLDRFPLEVPDIRELRKRARRYMKSCEAFEGLVIGEVEPRAFTELALPPRDYQRVAGSLMLEARGLLLADDLGVGKTASAFCALTDPRTRPALVVTLTHLPLQWEREIKRFLPRLRTHVLKTRTPYDVRLGPKADKSQLDIAAEPFPDVIITNYAKLSGWAETLAGTMRTVVFDEIQELRKLGSAKSAAARLLAAEADFRWGLSATPIFNYGGEFWNVLSVLRPDAMGTREEFLREWCSTSEGSNSDKAKVSAPEAFGTYLREAGLMLRRTRAEVGRELPPIQHIVHEVDANKKALEEAEDAAAELARIILSKDTSWQERGQAYRDIDWRLRQATGIAKAHSVAAFVRMLVEGGESKVVLYGWHRAVYDIWLERLKDLSPVMFTGSETAAGKERSRLAFVEGDARVLIMSLRAGAGLDGLQYVCRTVVHGELDWSPAVHEQADGRVFRDGQTDPVAAYYLMSDEGSDPAVSEVLGVKRWQIEGVRDLETELVAKLDRSQEGIRMLAQRYMKKQGSMEARC